MNPQTIWYVSPLRSLSDRFSHRRPSIRNHFFYSVLVAWSIPAANAQNDVYEIYEYDELGRLVSVVESSNLQGTADIKNKAVYHYDAADNITQTVSWDSNGPNAPPPPTNVTRGSHQGGGCYNTWRSSAGASYYEIGLPNTSRTETATGTYYSHDTLCATWIRACNSQDECSEKVDFPM